MCHAAADGRRGQGDRPLGRDVVHGGGAREGEEHVAAGRTREVQEVLAARLGGLAPRRLTFGRVRLDVHHVGVDLEVADGLEPHLGLVHIQRGHLGGVGEHDLVEVLAPERERRGLLHAVERARVLPHRERGAFALRVGEVQVEGHVAVLHRGAHRVEREVGRVQVGPEAPHVRVRVVVDQVRYPLGRGLPVPPVGLVPEHVVRELGGVVELVGGEGLRPGVAVLEPRGVEHHVGDAVRLLHVGVAAGVPPALVELREQHGDEARVGLVGGPPPERVDLDGPGGLEGIGVRGDGRLGDVGVGGVPGEQEVLGGERLGVRAPEVVLASERGGVDAYGRRGRGGARVGERRGIGHVGGEVQGQQTERGEGRHRDSVRRGPAGRSARATHSRRRAGWPCRCARRRRCRPSGSPWARGAGGRGRPARSSCR